MLEVIDVVKDYGLTKLRDIEYTGNFTIKYFSREQLLLLQSFFGVRRSKFDMKLLEKRKELLEELKGFKYGKNINS